MNWYYSNRRNRKIETQPNILRLATRGSKLAQVQADVIARLIGNCKIIKILSEGDQVKGPLRDYGGKGLFTSALETALIQNDADFAVHSAKDVPTVISDDFRLFFVTPREDCSDIFISKDGTSFDNLKSGSTIGTSSLRRQNQLLQKRTDIEIVSIRGNIETRITKVVEGEVDAIVLAKAGLNRSGLYQKYKSLITNLDIIPAGGQGALAVEVLSSNTGLCNFFDKLKDKMTHNAVSTERYVLAKLNANCHSSMAIHISPDGKHGIAMTSEPDGSNYMEFFAEGEDYIQTGKNLLDKITPIQ